MSFAVADKPVSSMTKAELIEYAESLGIDTTDLTTKELLTNAIEKAEKE